jgi:mono/diheme cytochrome c family protein
VRLLLLVLLVAGCARRVAPNDLKEPTPHFGDDWFAYRAKGLGLATPDEAKTRDASLSDTVPPAESDEQLKAEGEAIWLQSCAACHGKTGRKEGVTFAPGTKEPRTWGGMGASMGFFFGGNKMRAGLFRTIRDGKPDTAMVAWGPQLAREQIWALVFFLESL